MQKIKELYQELELYAMFEKYQDEGFKVARPAKQTAHKLSTEGEACPVVATLSDRLMTTSKGRR